MATLRRTGRNWVTIVRDCALICREAPGILARLFKQMEFRVAYARFSGRW